MRVANQARANQARLMPSFQAGRSYHTGAHGNDKLDEIFPKVVDFPGRHIGPRKHESKAMLTELGYNVSVPRSLVVELTGWITRPKRSFFN